MVGLRGIKQHQGMSRRRGVEHDKTVASLIHLGGKRPEDGDLFRARRTSLHTAAGRPFDQSNSVELITTVTQPASWKITAAMGVISPTMLRKRPMTL